MSTSKRTIDCIEFQLHEDGTITALGSTGNEYKITLQGEGSEDFCECLGFEHRKSCKHLTSARKLAMSVVPLEIETFPQVSITESTLKADDELKVQNGIARLIDAGHTPRMDEELTPDEEVDWLIQSGHTKPKDTQ